MAVTLATPDFLPVFAGALLTLMLVERFLNAFCFVLWYIMGISDADHHTKGPPALMVLQSAFTSSLSLLTSVLSVFANLLGSLAQWAFFAAVAVMVAGLLFIFFDFINDALFMFSDTWNSGIGASLQVLIVWPMRLLNAVFVNLAPIWNAIIWFWKKVPNQIIVQTVTFNLGVVINAGTALFHFVQACAASLAAWVGSFICCNSNGTADVVSSFCNPRCLAAGERVLDLIGPMSFARQFFVWTTQWARDLCAVLAGPIDFLTYPFMDINFAKAVHFFANGILYLVAHVPAVTTYRCSTYGSESLVMCIPDFEPVFQMLVAGLRSYGQFLDNWMDVGVLIVEATLDRPLPQCTSLPDLLRDFNFKENFFAANETTIVGMTPSLFARTDGLGVQYFSLSRDWQTMLYPLAFPFAIAIDHGLAAISHHTQLAQDHKGDDTTALLGCSCADTEAGMAITCGVATMDDQVRGVVGGGASVDHIESTITTSSK